MHGEKLYSGTGGLDRARLRLAFILGQARQFHDFSCIHAALRKHAGDLPSQIKGESVLLETLWVFEIGVARMPDFERVRHRPD